MITVGHNGATHPTGYAKAVTKGEEWISNEASGTTPEHITERILKKYGKDRTFSVPILTHCTLAGKLGDEKPAWKRVLQLPFELAAAPHQLFAALRLPVVSYALPALITIGIVKHQHDPTWFLPWRWLRNTLQSITLKKLETIQPDNGGFLEAIPLTSFVTMSLAASVGPSHPVAQKGLRFIFDSVQGDGSWAIDTNLATWVTTLSINALAQSSTLEDDIPTDQRKILLDYLLNQQYQSVHPYTHAAPGGWAWTHLPGGVPDADDTSGALWALHNINVDDKRIPAAAEHGIEWLISLQNSDGGVPTFCRGWANLPFDRSCADITAHAIKAVSHWKENSPKSLQPKIKTFEKRAYQYLTDHQFEDGSWVPLWFGNQDEPELQNKTYGTAQVVAALAPLQDQLTAEQQTMISNGVQSLLQLQKNDGSWGGGMQSPSSIEETSLALTALGVFIKSTKPQNADAILSSIQNGGNWLLQHTKQGTEFPASPIGFYFAELWYYEKLYPITYMLHALNTVQPLIQS
jgi:squalene-hopene/tetraprenyl-beta-curcumene cyclase